MPLNTVLRDALNEAINSYDFPCVSYDFASGREVQHPAMSQVESDIRSCLLADDLHVVKDGLSNVLYWGYARIGYRDHRVKRLRSQVSEEQLGRAGSLFRRLRGPGVVQIRKLGLPQFSGMSFISKVRMFLDPVRYVVLDQKIAGIRKMGSNAVLSDLSFGGRETQIRVSGPNERAYERWCQVCRRLAAECSPDGSLRAVDVERGIFHLLDSGDAILAGQILANAQQAE